MSKSQTLYTNVSLIELQNGLQIKMFLEHFDKN